MKVAADSTRLSSDLTGRVKDLASINCSLAIYMKEMKDTGTPEGQERPSAHLDYVTYGKAIFTMIAILIIILTILGNIMVVIAVCSEKKLRKVGNSFLVNLAISDCLVGVIVMPVALMYYLEGKIDENHSPHLQLTHYFFLHLFHYILHSVKVCTLQGMLQKDLIRLS